MTSQRLAATIRPAQAGDIVSITEIYNDAILTTTATFDTSPKSLAEQNEWFQSHGPRHPVLVAELDGDVIGWACLSEWSGRCAYSEAAECTFYVAKSHQGRGYGKQLWQTLIATAQSAGFHTLIARVADGSAASLHLIEGQGFRRVGTLQEVGRKFNKWIDVHILQLVLARND